MKIFRNLWFFWIGLGFLVVIFKGPLSEISANLIPETIDVSTPPLQAPSTSHWWGTDELGRDVFVRLLYGTGYSLAFSFTVASLLTFLGFMIGFLSSFIPKSLRGFFVLGIEVISALPFLPTALLALSFYPNQILVLGALKVLLGWGPLAQLVRVQSEVLIQGPIIKAAQSQGLSPVRIALKFLFPLLLPTGMSFFPLIIFSNVLTLATLDFFGLGFPIPTPTLAEMFRQFGDHPEAWWLFVFPLFIMATLLWGFQRRAKTAMLTTPF